MADQDSFSCPICLDLLKDPVAIPCGHSYCMGCIKGCWDQDDQRGVYSCPQCRQTFTPRPALNKNTLIAEMVAKPRKKRSKKPRKKRLPVASPVGDCHAGPGDVECDCCIGRKHKATKSCLVCLASYCETHIQPHYESAAFKKHKLVKASTQLQEKICSHHDKLIEIYCRTDQQCICYLCTMDEHKDHDTVSAAAEMTEKMKQLGATQRNNQQRIQEREKELQELRKAVESHRRSAQAAVEDTERIFTELIRSIQRRHSEMKELIRAQEKAELSQAEELLERLEQEIAELRRRDAEMEQLSHTEDHIHFLQSFQSLCAPPGSEDLPSIIVNPHFSFVDMIKVVSELKELLEDFCNENIANICREVQTLHILNTSSITEPKTREEFLQYSCQLTLDPNTAHRRIYLSEGNRKVTCNGDHPCPDHPERFDAEYQHQVLCREGLSGRCYWETERSRDIGISIAVSYKGIVRKGEGKECMFGSNDQSWRLECYDESFSFRHNSIGTKIRVAPNSSRVGVYLDHSAGTLSFYRVSDTMTLLHRVQTTFTQPLYAGFELWMGRCVKICDLQHDQNN